MRYLVSYTLNPPRPNPALEAELTKSALWWHHLDFTWMVVTAEPAEALYNRLAVHLLGTDQMLIIQLVAGAQYWGFLTAEAWKWVEDTHRL